MRGLEYKTTLGSNINNHESWPPAKNRELIGKFLTGQPSEKFKPGAGQIGLFVTGEEVKPGARWIPPLEVKPCPPPK